MPDPTTVLSRTPTRIGIAADHGGYELKEYLAGMLRDAGHEVIDLGDGPPKLDEDYPDFVVPLAHALARGEVERGVAICGSGVGASVVANKVAGVRACLIHETFSAHQGVEDDNLNMICLGGLVVGHALAWELVQTFLAARFSGAERHRRRLAKVAELESRKACCILVFQEGRCASAQNATVNRTLRAHPDRLVSENRLTKRSGGTRNPVGTLMKDNPLKELVAFGQSL
jgi:ribose 5-phosphate isomerase B